MQSMHHQSFKMKVCQGLSKAGNFHALFFKAEARQPTYAVLPDGDTTVWGVLSSEIIISTFKIKDNVVIYQPYHVCKNDFLH